MTTGPAPDQQSPTAAHRKIGSGGGGSDRWTIEGSTRLSVIGSLFGQRPTVTDAKDADELLSAAPVIVRHQVFGREEPGQISHGA